MRPHEIVFIRTLKRTKRTQGKRMNTIIVKWIGFLWNMREGVQGEEKTKREETTPTSAKANSEIHNYVLPGH